MLKDSTNFIAFRQEIERYTQSLTERAMNVRTDEQSTRDIKLRLAQIDDLMKFARGEITTLS
jgi:hypothetical protein